VTVSDDVRWGTTDVPAFLLLPPESFNAIAATSATATSAATAISHPVGLDLEGRRCGGI
jgi:hypothetical protein